MRRKIERINITIVIDNVENDLKIVVEKNGRFYDEVEFRSDDVDEFVNYMVELAYRIMSDRLVK